MKKKVQKNNSLLSSLLRLFPPKQNRLSRGESDEREGETDDDDSKRVFLRRLLLVLVFSREVLLVDDCAAHDGVSYETDSNTTTCENRFLCL